MFSKEESKKLRQQFWIFFGRRYPRKWVLYNTKLKDFNLKFDFDTKKAIVAIDVEHPDPIERAYYFDKLLQLETLLRERISPELIFDKHYVLPNGKEIARCYVQLDGVSIHNKFSWTDVFEFFYLHMDAFEKVYLDYEDFIKA